MGCLNVTATQKLTGITVSATYKPVTMTASAVQICGIPTDIPIGFPLYVADGRLYAADAALYVNR